MIIRTCGASILLLAGTVIAGDLNPPAGPIAPTMKTLDQVEPRIPINSETAPGNSTTLHIITEPGSYYLTGDIRPTVNRSAIRIDADNVSIDLGGFTIDGAATTSKTGISTLGSVTRGGRIRNGEVQNWSNGIFLLGEGCVVENVTVRNCTSLGIQASDHTIVRRCTLLGNGGNSIRSFDSCVIEHCVIETSASAAIFANAGNVIRDNLIRLAGASTDGIVAGGIWTRVEGNNVTGSAGDVGISAAGSCFVARNTVTASIATPYSINAAAKFGPIVTTDGDLSAVANGDHPLANFVY